MDLEGFMTRAVAADGKVACETTLSDAPAADLPADSFRLPVDQQVEWIDRNAAPIYEREDSTKGSSNPKSSSSQPAQTVSQRFSGNLKRRIIGLPRKLRLDHLGHSARRSAPGFRIVPDRRATAVVGSEPASPKVSCLGKILSDRERIGFQRKKHRFFSSLLRFFCVKGRKAEEADAAAWDAVAIAKARPAPPSAAPSLAAARKFASGRSWASLEAEEVDLSGPLDVSRAQSLPLDGDGWKSGPFVGLECGKNSSEVGHRSI